MDNSNSETPIEKKLITFGKRSSLKTSNPLNVIGLTDLNKKKRHSVSFKNGTLFNVEKIKAKFDIGNKENENDKEKKKKFIENRRESVKNEFSLVKELMKKNSMEEIEESEDEELKENTKKNIEEGKKKLNESISSSSSSSSSSSQSEKEKKINFEIENIIQINYINNNNSVINKEVYIKLKNEKDNLEKKIYKVKNILEEIKIRYELEISKRDGIILSLKEQNDNLKNIINKYNLFQNNINKEKKETQNKLLKQIKKNEELNYKNEQLNEILKLKNDQINTNNKYSIQLIRMVNDLKDKIDKDKNQRKQNKIVNNLNKEIQNLKKQLKTNKSLSLGLEAKNKILENNYNTLSNSYNELKNLQDKEEINKITLKYKFSSPNIKNYENKRLEFNSNFKIKKTPITIFQKVENNNFDNKTKRKLKSDIDLNYNENANDKLLISENVLPKIFPSSRSAKDYKSMKNYSQMDIFHTQNDISHINQLMSDIINDME